jgi:hypothetical protein
LAWLCVTKPEAGTSEVLLLNPGKDQALTRIERNGLVELDGAEEKTRRTVWIMVTAHSQQT